MIGMRIAVTRLVQHPGRTNHGLRRGLVARGIPEETSLDVVGAEEPLHTGLRIHHKGSHEMPVARFIERKHPVSSNGEAVTIELQPAATARGHSPSIAREKYEVRVPSCAVASVPVVCASTRIGEVAHAQRIPAWKHLGHRLCGTFDSLD